MDQTKRGARQQLNSAFWTGFMMGLSAPALMLNAMCPQSPPKSVHDALADDWSRVGGDMRTAITKTRENKAKEAA